MRAGLSTKAVSRSSLRAKHNRARGASRKVLAGTAHSCLDSYCLDSYPASYGIDLRRVVLSNSGLPGAVVDRLGLTINGQVLPIPLEVAVVFAFGAVMLGIAVVMFQCHD